MFIYGRKKMKRFFISMVVLLSIIFTSCNNLAVNKDNQTNLFNVAISFKAKDTSRVISSPTSDFLTEQDFSALTWTIVFNQEGLSTPPKFTAEPLNMKDGVFTARVPAGEYTIEASSSVLNYIKDGTADGTAIQIPIIGICQITVGDSEETTPAELLITKDLDKTKTGALSYTINVPRDSDLYERVLYNQASAFMYKITSISTGKVVKNDSSKLIVGESGAEGTIDVKGIPCGYYKLELTINLHADENSGGSVPHKINLADSVIEISPNVTTTHTETVSTASKIKNKEFYASSEGSHNGSSILYPMNLSDLLLECAKGTYNDETTSSVSICITDEHITLDVAVLEQISKSPVNIKMTSVLSGDCIYISEGKILSKKKITDYQSTENSPIWLTNSSNNEITANFVVNGENYYDFYYPTSITLCSNNINLLFISNNNSDEKINYSIDTASNEKYYLINFADSSNYLGKKVLSFYGAPEEVSIEPKLLESIITEGEKTYFQVLNNEFYLFSQDFDTLKPSITFGNETIEQLEEVVINAENCNSQLVITAKESSGEYKWLINGIDSSFYFINQNVLKIDVKDLQESDEDGYPYYSFKCILKEGANWETFSAKFSVKNEHFMAFSTEYDTFYKRILGNRTYIYSFNDYVNILNNTNRINQYQVTGNDSFVYMSINNQSNAVIYHEDSSLDYSPATGEWPVANGDCVLLSYYDNNYFVGIGTGITSDKINTIYNGIYKSEYSYYDNKCLGKATQSSLTFNYSNYFSNPERIIALDNTFFAIEKDSNELKILNFYITSEKIDESSSDTQTLNLPADLANIHFTDVFKFEDGIYALFYCVDTSDNNYEYGNIATGGILKLVKDTNEVYCVECNDGNYNYFGVSNENHDQIVYPSTQTGSFNGFYGPRRLVAMHDDKIIVQDFGFYKTGEYSSQEGSDDNPIPVLKCVDGFAEIKLDSENLANSTVNYVIAENFKSNLEKYLVVKASYNNYNWE